jgi:endonuclease/exonuclease/phosphatase (EEP) superfamily protein YafD
MIKITIEVVAILLILCTSIPLLRINHWIVRSLDFPRLQLLTLIGVILLLQLITRQFETPIDKILLLFTIGSGIYQAWWVFNYSRLVSFEVKDAKDDNNEHLCILSTNVLMTNQNYKSLLDRINKYKPDIIVTLETNSWWGDKLTSIEQSYPHTVKCPLENLYGMHVYSKLKLHNAEIRYLVEDDKPSIHAYIKLNDDTKVRLHFLHPAPPSPTENKTSTERDAELLVLARSISNTEEPVIVAGDLNDVAWSKTTRTFRKISGLLDPRIGRGTFNTFHAKYWFARWPLDHLFHSKHFTLVNMQRLESIGSDHFPLLTTLAHEPDAIKKQHGIKADKEDKEWSKEKVVAEGVSETEVPNPTKSK